SGAQTLTYIYYPGVDNPNGFARMSDGIMHYFITDYPGNVQGVVNSSNTIENEYRYTPFGVTMAGTSETVTNRLHYMSREWDSESGLYYVRGRYYDPDIQRFVSEDPVGLAGGINPYAFVGNNPVQNVDPNGLQDDKCPGTAAKI